MPSWCVCRAGLGRACVQGNASPALRMLGGMVASEWHGRGALLGRARAKLARGIGQGVQC
jgi:hypothetical protein